VQNCHSDRHAICKQGTELNIIYNIYQYVGLLRGGAPVAGSHVFLLQYEGMGDFIRIDPWDVNE
jgi:hypothetical protein